MDWFRAYSAGILRGSLSDASDEIQLIWIKFLAIESETKNRDGCLRFCEGKPYANEYIATLCLKPVDAVQRAIAIFEQDIDKKTNTPRVSRETDGSLRLNKWLIYQYEQDMKKQAERAKKREDKAPLTIDERNQKQEIQAIELAYKFPNGAKKGIERRDFDNSIKPRVDTKTGEIEDE
jgi:hypothetical protein